MGSSLGHGAMAEHQEPVGRGGEDAGVVADQQERGTEPVAQAAEEGGEFHHAGGIEGSEGLVGDDQGGPAGEGLGDGHALALTAGEVVWIGGQNGGRGGGGGGRGGGGGDARQRQQFGGVAPGVVRAEDFGDLLADPQDGIEGQ